MKLLTLTLLIALSHTSTELPAADSPEATSEIVIFAQLDASMTPEFKCNNTPLEKALQQLATVTASTTSLDFEIPNDLKNMQVNLDLAPQSVANVLSQICHQIRCDWSIKSGKIRLRRKPTLNPTQSHLQIEAFTITRHMLYRPHDMTESTSGVGDPFADPDPTLWYRDFTPFDPVEQGTIPNP